MSTDDRRALLEQALFAIDDLQARLDTSERARHEPIAIVGMSCRFPGQCVDPESYWRLLAGGVDAVTEVPAARWDAGAYYDADPDAPGKSSTRFGGFLDRVDEFDPGFFGISPREAVTMDPQQRLVLEVAWEALENAGCAPDRLAGSATGVFVGITSSDYGHMIRQGTEAPSDIYLATGNALNAAAGRLAFTLGLQGPCVALDTACSSSLVAVHLACQSLRAGESSLAIAGGVNAILMPDLFVLFSKWGMMAPDGRCKTFDAAADGFVRGEGCGIVVLKRLSDAQADGDHVFAVIPGSAVNQDGRSSGLTVPNGLAQQRLLESALAFAGIAAAEVDYVEAHGTGTSLGDPIEVEALGEVFRIGRTPERPLLIGSVKTNLGHLESASGVAGLMKVILALQHEAIPAHLHFKTPNPRIAWQTLPLAVPTTLTAWTRGSRRRIAGVSAFGLSGTNAHILVEEAPVGEAPAAGVERPLHVLTLSARTPDALRALAVRHAERRSSDGEDPIADVCFTANTGRAGLAHRVAIVGATGAQIRRKLSDVAADLSSAGAMYGEVVAGESPKIAFLFTGQGAQYIGMGRQLFETQPLFRRALEQCDALLRGELERPLLEVLYPSDSQATPLDETAYTQPALFAVEYALGELWRSWGITPHAVLGHSVGEYAAACAAGVMNVEDALLLVAQRGRLMQALPAGGAMAAVMATESQVARAIGARSRGVSIAAVNGPDQIVLSGPHDAVAAVVSVLEAQNITATWLPVSHAFHSALLDPMLDRFEELAGQVQYARPRIPIVSNVTGELVKGELFSHAGYWRKHARETVQFARGVQALDAAGYRVFVEVGPKPALLGTARRVVSRDDARWLPSLRPGRGDWEQMLESLGTLYAHGAGIDWAGFDAEYPRRKAISLPTYPFQRQRYWVEQESRGASAPVDAGPSWKDWLYDLTWEPAAIGADGEPGGALPVLERSATAVFAQLFAQHDLGAYAKSQPSVDALAAAYIEQAFVDLGWSLELGTVSSGAALMASAGVLPRHARLLDRMLAILAEDGILRRDGAEWEVCRSAARRDSEALASATLAAHPSCAAEMALLRRCGPRLADVLRGRCAALDLLFPDGATDQLEAIYRDAPAARAFNTLIATTIAAALARSSEGRPIRILEVGAGTGGTTAAILPLLDSSLTHYVYSDLSQALLGRAARTFEKYSFVEYRTLDISRNPAEQGFDGQAFDIIVAANVLHATADLRQTLTHVGQLLAPNGLLLMLEGTAPQRLIDLTFGLTEGWWAFRDLDLRPDHALLSGAQWTRLLREQGFSASAIVPGSSGGGLSVVLAQGIQRAPEIHSGADRRCWLLFADGLGAGRALGDVVRARGDRCVVVEKGARFEVLDADRIAIDPIRPDDYAALVAHLAADAGLLAGVAHLWSVDEQIESTADVADVMAVEERVCGSVLYLVQALVKSALEPMPRLTLFTRGAQDTPADRSIAIAQAPVWALSRIVELEHPELQCLRIDLDPVNTAWADEALAVCTDVLFNQQPGEGHLARRGGRWLGMRLASSAPGTALAAPETYVPDATYLITGGTSGLGLLAARRMVEHGARHLVLIGRSEPSVEARTAIDAMRRDGAEILVRQADVADRAALDRIVSEVDRERTPLRGIVHSAGALDDGVVLQQAWSRFRTVFAAKVQGAWNLHQISRDWPLDFFVLFSSAAAFMGSPGQSNHAAGSAFMDALARDRRKQGLCAVSINWGAWSDVGAAARRGIVAAVETRGVGAIDPARGLEIFDRVVNGGQAQVAVVPIRWAELLGRATARQKRSFLRAFADLQQPTARPAINQRTSQRVEAAPAAPSDLSAVLSRLEPVAQRARLLAHVREQVIAVLGLDPSAAVSNRQGLRDMGLDSLMALELRTRLQRSVGKSLPATLAFDCPNIDAVVQYIARDVLALPDTAATPDPRARKHVVDRATTTASDPIAVIGIGCRFPGGANDPEAFWRLLRDGVDAIREVPADRWDVDAYYDANPDAPGRMSTRCGGFVADLDRFDPQFFGIAPREAVGMDPQQRMLLEVTWETLEHAGCPADALGGTRTGVFVGIGHSEYGQLQVQADETAVLSPYYGSGNAVSVAAGRLSYVLGLQGPNLSVNTACSSSLVAVHLAVQSLRNDECRLALAGGVNAMLLPETTVILSKSRMLGPGGRCRTFDADADGFVRAEGCGMVALKRLSDAQADGDRVLAVIRGTAINQDGRSSGLTVPNGGAQEALIREALDRAQVAPGDLDYVEAHGTGTSLGDPIEIKALGSVFGEGARSEPLYVGSAKTNVGHLEAAAGIVGFIKVVLALTHGEIPPHLHFRTPNPLIAWETTPVAVPTSRTPWPRGARRRIAGVSAFGFSGTNAHVIVEEAPVLERAALPIDRPVHVLTLSAKGDAELRALAERYEVCLADERDLSLADICFTANAGRSHLSHRLAIVGDSRDAVHAGLTAAVRGDLTVQIVRGEVAEGASPRMAFLFTGQGAQRPGMGRDLYATQPTFRAALDRCAAILVGELEMPLLDVLYGDATALLNETAYTQPALFAVEYALAELWRSWGVRPAAVLGHSIGEYVAACVAGVFSLEDALRLVAARGRLMQALPRDGGMVAVNASEAMVVPLLAPHKATVSIAGVNAADQLVLSGAAEPLTTIVAQLEAQEILATWLPVSHAFHSPLMAPMLDAFEAVAARVTYHEPQIPVVTNVSGAVAAGGDLTTADYWRQHIRGTVQFTRGMETLARLGIALFVEIGPAPTLTGLGRRTIKDPAAQWLASLRPGQDDWATLTASVAQLYVAGVPIDWNGFDRDYPRLKVALPTYPFQRQRYWIALPAKAPAPKATGSLDADPIYQIDWKATSAADRRATTSRTHRRCVVFSDVGELGAQIAARLSASGQQATSVDRSRSADIARLWNQVADKAAGHPLDVVHLSRFDAAAPIDGTDLHQAAVDECAALLTLVQSIARAGRPEPVRLRVVTCGAQAIGAQARVSLSQAPLVGMVRAIMTEHPELECSSIDLDPLDDGRRIEALVDELAAESTGEQIGLRGGARFAARLVPLHTARPSSPCVRGDASYLITGGLGALGLDVARWMVEQGARHIVLVGRRGASESSAAAVRVLEANGATVRVVRADVTRGADVARVLDEISRDLPPLRGIVHAAGVLDDRLLGQQTRERFDRVLAPKVAGTWNLHVHTRGVPLDFFVLFASVAGVVGSAGQGNYAAANAFMDAFAHERRREGLPAISIDWGPWADGGMAAGVTDADRRRWAQAGIESMPSRTALRWFGDLAAAPVPQAIVLPVRWPDFLAQSGAWPFLAEIAAQRGAKSEIADVESVADLRQQLDAARPHRRRALLHAHVFDLVRDLLGLQPPARFDAGQGFRDLGMDSLMALDLRNRLQRSVGRSLPSTVAFDRPTVDALVQYLADDVLALPVEEGMAFSQPPAAAAGVTDVLSNVESLSDEEVERLLSNRIGVES